MSALRRSITFVPFVTLVSALLLAGCSSSTSGTATSSSAPAAAAGDGPAAVSSSAPAAADSSRAAALSPAAPSTGSSPASDPASSTAESGSAGDATTTSTSAADRTPAEPAQCASVAQKYGAIINATLLILQGRTGPEPFDAAGLATAVDGSTMGTIPAELEPDFARFKAAAQQLEGKDLTAAAGVLNGPEITTASSNIDQFLSDRC